MKISCIFFAFFFFLVTKANCQSISEYSEIGKTYSECDISKMIANKMNQSKDWGNLIDQSIDEYILLLDGTDIIKTFKSVDTLAFKFAFLNTFPTFYKNMFAETLCKSTQDRKFLTIFYYNVMGFNLTDDDEIYYTNAFDSNFEKIMRENMRIYRTDNMIDFTTNLGTEYKKIIQTKLDN